MVPTLVRSGPYRFFIVLYDCAERMHVHASGGSRGAAKLWLEPEVEVAAAKGYTRRQLGQLESVAREHQQMLIRRWIEECEGSQG